jgi:hypothetical protein
MPDVGLTQGMVGRVYNRRTRRSFNSLNAALAASQNRDLLFIAGTLDEAVDLAQAPDGVMIVGQTIRGFPATLTVASCPLTTMSVIHASFRNGPVQIINVNIKVPDGCFGILSVANGEPLTVRGCRIFGASQLANFSAIALFDEMTGPFVVQDNIIPNYIIAGGIGVDGDGANTMQLTIKGNRIGSLGSHVGVGIVLSDIPSSSNVMVEKNLVDAGSNTSNSMIGILLNPADDGVQPDGIMVRRNTVLHFQAGISLDGAPNTHVIANLLQDNDRAVEVDLNNDSGSTPLINENNFMCTNLAACKAAGFVGVYFGVGGYNLDARENYWGNQTGPDSMDAPPGANMVCPEAAGANCNGPAGGGAGLASDANGNPDCKNAVGGSVRTCPFLTRLYSLAGA